MFAGPMEIKMRNRIREVYGIICRNQGPFRLGAWYGGWTAGYAILGNLLNASLKIGDFSTLKIHLISFMIGCLLGAACISGKIINGK